MVNTHGLKMRGLHKVAEETKALTGYYSGCYYQVNYDMSTGEVFAKYHCSYGQNWWTQYYDKNIINCGNISSSMAMQDIADMIWEKVQWVRELLSTSA